MSLNPLRELRSLRVLLIHARDQDCEELLMHLRCLGCDVQHRWPPTERAPDGFDIVILSFKEGAQQTFEWDPENSTAALVVVADYDNPTVLEAMMRFEPVAVIGRPIRASGILTNLMVARSVFCQQRQLKNRIEKLQSKLRSVRRIERAKEIIIKQRNVTESEAYHIIRAEAMNRRVSTDEIATSIIEAAAVILPAS